MDKSETLLSASLTKGEIEDVNVEMEGNAEDLMALHALISGALFAAFTESGFERGEAVTMLIACVQKGLSKTVQSDIAKAKSH